MPRAGHPPADEHDVPDECRRRDDDRPLAGRAVAGGAARRRDDLWDRAPPVLWAAAVAAQQHESAVQSTATSAARSRRDRGNRALVVYGLGRRSRNDRTAERPTSRPICASSPAASTVVVTRSWTADAGSSSRGARRRIAGGGNLAPRRLAPGRGWRRGSGRGGGGRRAGDVGGRGGAIGDRRGLGSRRPARRGGGRAVGLGSRRAARLGRGARCRRLGPRGAPRLTLSGRRLGRRRSGGAIGPLGAAPRRPAARQAGHDLAFRIVVFGHNAHDARCFAPSLCRA